MPEAEQPAPAEQRSLSDWLKLIVGVVAIAALIVFFTQNQDEANIEFLWFDWDMSLVWALLASAVVGALAALLFSALRRRRKKPQE